MALNLQKRPTSAAPAAANQVPQPAVPVYATPVAPAPSPVAATAAPVAAVQPQPVASPNLPVVPAGAEETSVSRSVGRMQMGGVTGVPDNGGYLAPFLTLLDPNSKFCKKDIKNIALAGNWLYDGEVPFGTELPIIPVSIRCFIVESQKYDPSASEEVQNAPKREWDTEAQAIADGYVRHDSQSEKFSSLLYTNAVTMMCMVQAPVGLEANAPLQVTTEEGLTLHYYPAMVNVRKTKAGPVAKIARDWIATGGTIPLFANMWILGSEYKDKPVRYMTTKVTKLGAAPKAVVEKLSSMYAKA